MCGVTLGRLKWLGALSFSQNMGCFTYCVFLLDPCGCVIFSCLGMRKEQNELDIFLGLINL